jgi:formate dehydrogenase major subunit
MSDQVNFKINGQNITARPEETIWQVANRLGIEIPHLCYLPEKSYRADGNCRACMVEIDGERTLAASCIRQPTEGMIVNSASERAKKSREMVFELLRVDQPLRENSHDSKSKFWDWVDKIDLNPSERYPTKAQPEADKSHTAIAVHLDACIQCNLCVRACREVQSNDVIGMANRGHQTKIR